MTEYKIEIAIGAVLLFGIALWLIFPFAFSADTIFLVNGNNETPEPCSGNTGLVLAQNLTDLCDVTIISPTTNEIIQYNGTQWINVDSAVFNDTITCTNLGTGTIICPSYSGDNVNIRTLIEGTGIDITNSSTEITITNTLPESTVCNNSTGGIGICINDDVTLRNLVAGTSISISSNATHITITNTAPDNTVCANVGSGKQVYKDGECNFRTLVGSPDISVTNTTDTIVIDYNGTHVTSVTSNSNSTIGVVPTTGAVVLYPAWEKLCSNSATANSQSVSCSSFTARKFLHIEVAIVQNTSGTSGVNGLRFNSDSGTNYAWRASTNGGGDATSASATECRLFGNNAYAVNNGGVQHLDIVNVSSLRKIGYGLATSGMDTGSATIPGRVESNCKWDNTSAQITTVTLSVVSGTSGFTSNTQLSIWGHD